MVIAETKRQMHETLEMKEEEIAQLRTKIQQVVGQKEELQEQREKAEKAGEREHETVSLSLYSFLFCESIIIA